MPELPEVEVTRQRIFAVLVGRRISLVKTSKPSYFFLTPPKLLRRALSGLEALDLTRHGKYLIVNFAGGRGLLLHLGMTGQLFSSEAVSPRLLSSAARSALNPEQMASFAPDVHTHLEFRFEDDGPRVYFRDVRKFGKVRLLEPGEIEPRIARLGADALVIGAGEFFAKAQTRGVPLKSLLLDQSVLAGAGNIYADEALFLAKLHPTLPARAVSREQCQVLIRSLRRVLRRAIATGGSSINDFVGPDGADGHYQDERHVYGRTGEACKRCRTPIERLVIGQRSTHYCPRCQKQ